MRGRRTIWIVSTISITVATIAGFWAFNQYGPDLLEIRSKMLVGFNAINCGSVPIAGNPKRPTDCALAAEDAGKSFRVRYEIRGYDSEVAVSITRDPAGKV